jgi:microcystin-dependent protein
MSGGETSLSGNDNNSVALSYTINFEQFYLNGILLVRGVDYVATNGTTITGLTALSSGDIVEIIALSEFSLANAYTKPESDQRFTPIGSIVSFAGSTAPTGWSLCDGSAISRVDYSTLFTAIGTTYGVGNGTTTFNLPNLKGRVPVGLDSAQTEFDALGETGGVKAVTLTAAQSGLPAHSHGITDPSHSHYLDWRNNVNVANFAGAYGSVGSNAAGNTYGATTGISINNNTATNASASHDNLQPYIVMHYIIRIS